MEAEHCITGLSLTHANYEQAISLLKDRFGQKHKIINAHMQSLLDLPSPTLSVGSLRIFYDKMESSIRDLESLQQCHTYALIWCPVSAYNFRKTTNRHEKKSYKRTWKS